MDEKLLNAFNDDISHESVRLLFEDPDQWNTLVKNGYGEEGMYDDIEIDIRNFVETLPHYKKGLIDMPSVSLTRIEMSSFGDIIISLSFGMTIKEGMVEYTWSDENDEEESYIDIEGSIEVSAYFENWKLDRIDAMIMTSESEWTLEYDLWPRFNLPDFFNGAFGQKSESISNLSLNFLKEELI